MALFTEVLKENFDGVTYTLFNIIERIPKDRFEFLFITPLPPSDNVKLPFPVIVCRYFPLPFMKGYRVAFPYFDRKLRAALEDFKPDLIHWVAPTFLTRYAFKYAKEHRIPLLGTYHTHYPMYVDYYFKYLPFLKFLSVLVPMLLRFYYNNTDLVCVPTKPILEELAELGIERKRMMIWARGIDMTMFNPQKRDNKYIDALCGKGTIRVLFVSRLFWVKEITTIIGIYKKLSKTHPNVTMVITGDGPQKKYMEKRMPNAVFTGKLINNDLNRIYASCDIFLFPSITETFGNVNLEALASGLPIVAAAKGGQCGIIKEGETGFLVEPKNVDAFCEKISYLVNNPNILKKMSKNAVAYARTQKWETLCKEMFRSYERVVAENKKRVEESDETAV